jgi:hypothetical protein
MKKIGDLKNIWKEGGEIQITVTKQTLKISFDKRCGICLPVTYKLQWTPSFVVLLFFIDQKCPNFFFLKFLFVNFG